MPTVMAGILLSIKLASLLASDAKRQVTRGGAILHPLTSGERTVIFENGLLVYELKEVVSEVVGLYG